jgi:hypothetical protein
MRLPLSSSTKTRFVQIVAIGVVVVASTSCSSSPSSVATDTSSVITESDSEPTSIVDTTIPVNGTIPPVAATSEGSVGSISTEATDEYAIDGLPLGLSSDELQSKIGKAPTTESDLTLEGATGEYVTTWKFEGVEAMLSAVAPDGPANLRALTITSPSVLKTKEGIGIGATEAEVTSTYGLKVNSEESTPGKIVVGSVFGGMIFTIANGAVSEIFVGAAAE